MDSTILDYNSFIVMETVDGRIILVDLYGRLIAVFVDGQWICAF